MDREEIIKGLKIATRKIGGCCDNGGWLDNDEALARKSCEEAIKLLEQEPCEDCISRNEALSVFRPRGISEDVWKESNVYKKLTVLSPVTPQPNTGHWIFKNDNIAIPTGYYQCSECEKGKLLNKDNFCPNCGAKMEGEKKMNNLKAKVICAGNCPVCNKPLKDGECIFICNECKIKNEKLMELENQKTGYIEADKAESEDKE